MEQDKNLNIELLEDDFDTKKLFAKIIDNWKLLVGCIIGGLIVATLIILYADSKFKIHSQVLIGENTNTTPSSPSSMLSGSSAISDFSSLFGGLQSNVYNEAAVLQSRDLIQSVVNKLNLNVRYYETGIFKNKEIFGDQPFNVRFTNLSDTLLSYVSFDLTRNTANKTRPLTIKCSELDTTFYGNYYQTFKSSIGDFIVTPTGRPFNGDEYKFRVNSVDYVIDKYQNDWLTVTVTNENATTIDIELNSNLRKKGEAVLKQLLNEYKKEDIVSKNEIADSTLSFIQQREAIESGELDRIETKVRDFKQVNNIADLTEQEKLMVDNASDYYNKFNQVDVQLDVVNTMLAYVSDVNNNNRPIPSITTANADPNLLILLENYNTLQVTKDRMNLSATEKSPYIQNVALQIANLRKDILSNLTNQKKALVISRNNLKTQNSTVTGLMQKVPSQEKTFLDLYRQQNLKQQLYLFLLEQGEQTAITKASNISGARVIETPKAEFERSFPKISLLLPAGVLGGIFVCIMWIFITGYLNNKIENKDDIEKITKANVLAEISHNSDSFFVLKDLPKAIISEQFRYLRSNLQFVLPNSSCNTILLTSSMSGEGKSFVATNLAILYAGMDKKVLIMELDLRKPKISSNFGIENKRGFSNFIISDLKAEDIIQPSGLDDNISIMVSGPVPPNPAELLANAKVPVLFENLKKQYDIIIIDTPPIGIVIDAQALNRYADACLYVVRQNYTYKNQLKVVNDLRESGKMSKLYLVFNDVKKKTSERYGYGYGYSYGYGYGEKYGYGVDGPKKSKKNRAKK